MERIGQSDVATILGRRREITQFNGGGHRFLLEMADVQNSREVASGAQVADKRQQGACRSKLAKT